MMNRLRAAVQTSVLALALAGAAGISRAADAGTDTPSGVSAQAALAADNLNQAIAALKNAQSGRDQVVALTQTIRAYEEGLAALRESLRQAQLREATIKRRLESKRNEVALLLSVLTRMEKEPGPSLLLHPAGPVGTARSSMLIGDITPSLQIQAEQLKAQLQEVADLRTLQASSQELLNSSLFAAQDARSQLSQAISERRDLPKRYVEDPQVMIDLVASAQTLDDFATGLAFNAFEVPLARPFIAALGQLPLPSIGRVIRKPNEADSAGVRRPGLTLATRAGALVTAPWPATIRYLGPLLDYGNVIIIEPGNGYLMIMSGMAEVFGEPGEVVDQGAPLGLMGGLNDNQDPDLGSVSASSRSGASVQDTETLYLELRLGAAPVDPTEWFAATATLGE